MVAYHTILMSQLFLFHFHTLYHLFVTQTLIYQSILFVVNYSNSTLVHICTKYTQQLTSENTLIPYYTDKLYSLCNLLINYLFFNILESTHTSLQCTQNLFTKSQSNFSPNRYFLSLLISDRNSFLL